jgi:hypothetical protein
MDEQVQQRSTIVRVKLWHCSKSSNRQQKMSNVTAVQKEKNTQIPSTTNVEIGSHSKSAKGTILPIVNLRNVHVTYDAGLAPCQSRDPLMVEATDIKYGNFFITFREW